MFCSQCGNANDIAAKYCSNCGSVLPQAVQNAPTPHAKINASGNSEEFYKAIVGPKNQGYYLHHFSRFDSKGKVSASWHWPAFFVTFSWFLYRKMWLNALIYFFLLGLVNILYVFAETAEKSGGTIIYKVYLLLYFVGIVILPPMYANALYYKHCKKKISETSASSHDLQSRLSELSEKGRTSIVGVVFSVMQIIAIIGILAAVAVPAYQSYIKKATSTEITTPALQQQKSESEMKPGIVFKDCTDCPEMVVIPAGSFKMGSNNGELNETPVHRVSIGNSFAMGQTEVTLEQWLAVMDNNPSNFSDCGDNCPVDQVSWDDVQVFIQKLNTKTGKNYRLPSEAEWEYACRAGGQQEYCGSDNLDSIGWYGGYGKNGGGGSSGAKMNPVGLKQPNAFGLYDMSGNVWEYVEDIYHDSYAGAPIDGSAWQGIGAKRVLRSGSWYRLPEDARASSRGSIDQAFHDESPIRGFGFRLVRILP